MEENLEVRTQLEYYWQNIAEVPEKTINTFRVKTPKGGNYIGQEILEHQQKLMVYYCWLGIDEALMFLYLGSDAFNRQCKLLKCYYSAMAKTFPNFINAAENGINDQYYQYALIKVQMEGSEDEPFWCMASIIENVHELDITNPYIKRKYGLLFDACHEVLQEKDAKKLSNWDIIKTNLVAFIEGCAGCYKPNETQEEIEKLIKPYNLTTT